MKGFKLSLFLFIILWPIVNSSIDDNSAHEPQITYQGVTTIYENNTHLAALEQHQDTTIQEDNLNTADVNIINMTKEIVDYTQDVKKICYAQVNEIIWKLPTMSSNSEEKILKFRTINDRIGYSNSDWYLKSINEIDIVEMHPKPYMHQIEFTVKIKKRKIYLSRVYPTYPEISGFEILQFIANLAFQCKFSIEIFDVSDISPVYVALYEKSYYGYHFKGVDLSQNFLFKNIVVKKKKFLECFAENMGLYARVKTVGLFENLPQLFNQNILACENSFVPVEFCPMTFSTQRIFYKESFQYCIDWSSIGGLSRKTHIVSQRFKILSEDITRIMKKQQSNIGFIKISRELDKTNIKTYDEIKTHIFDISFLMELFSTIFELCFVELEKIKSDPNPEDIFKLYLRPCVIPNINLFLKYYTKI